MAARCEEVHSQIQEPTLLQLKFQQKNQHIKEQPFPAIPDNRNIKQKKIYIFFYKLKL